MMSEDLFILMHVLYRLTEFGVVSDRLVDNFRYDFLL